MTAHAGEEPARWPRPAAPARTVEGPLAAVLYASRQPDSVLLLHSLGLDRHIWLPLVDVLATRVAVMALDLPGHGASPSASAPTIEAMADHVVATMNAAGLQQAAIVGLSFGGSVAQAVAVRHPERVRALALLDTTAYYGDGAPRTWAGRVERARHEGLPALSTFQLERWFSDRFRGRRPDLCDAVSALFAATSLDGYADACTALGVMDLREGIASVRCPTVVVVGDLDLATPVAHAEQIHRSVAGSRLHVLRGCKHLSVVERPAAVIGLIADTIGA